MMLLGFGLIIIGAATLASGIVRENMLVLYFISTICTALGIYAARVLYFSLLEEGRIPMALTGTAVGLISLIGFTPDIFMGPLTGYFLDNFEGINGHRFVFGIMALFALIGLLFTMFFDMIINSKTGGELLTEDK
ncbi:MAG: hypothetical protein JKY54_01325 [Flavobacteriales bacterium]|nr:hypothetical protein [Flavobacteriales bacterium]